LTRGVEGSEAGHQSATAIHHWLSSLLIKFAIVMAVGTAHCAALQVARNRDSQDTVSHWVRSFFSH